MRADILSWTSGKCKVSVKANLGEMSKKTRLRTLLPIGIPAESCRAHAQEPSGMQAWERGCPSIAPIVVPVGMGMGIGSNR